MTMVKRVALALLTLVILVASFGVASAALIEPYYTFQTTSALNCREDPSIKSEVLYKFNRYSYIKVYSVAVSPYDNTLWAETRYTNRHKVELPGYVSMNYVQCVDNRDFPKLSAFMEVNRENVNVYSMDSYDSSVVGVVKLGTILRVTNFYPSFSGEIWAMCFENGETIGYIDVANLRAYEKKYEVIEFNESSHMMVTGGSVYMREGPSTNYREIAILHHKDVVRAYGMVETYDSAWVKCTFGKYSGYVSYKYLEDYIE